MIQMPFGTKKLLIFSTVILALISFAPYSDAQGIPVGTNLDITLSINNPSPGQEVTVTVRSFNTDIKSSNITWMIDGKTAKKGIGETVITVTAPQAGKEMDIDVTAVAIDGTVHRGSISLGSGTVDMILESNGYVHPFFRGKVAVSYQNSIKIVAIPHLYAANGKELDPKSLIYEWRRNNQVMDSQSGYGKQSIVIQGDIIPRPFSVTVSVTNREKTAEAVSLVNIGFQSPTIALYIDDPLFGPIYEQSIGEAIRIGSEREVGVLAVPFGFNKPKDGLGDLQLEWFINGKRDSSLAKNMSLILRAPNGTAGASNIDLSIKNAEKILQGARAGFKAIYSGQSQQAQAETPTF